MNIESHKAPKSSAPVVLAVLRGGLGNQMFQYAAARQLAILNSAKILLDTRAYTAEQPDAKLGVRTFTLKHFRIEASVALAAEINNIFYAGIGNRLRNKAEKFLPVRGRRFLFEDPLKWFKYDCRLNRRFRGAIFLEGFWQSERYFRAIRDTIINDFTPAEPLSRIVEDFGRMLESCNSVSVHVRYGDNATKAAPNHGVLPHEYYATAARNMIERIGSAIFVVFSDDPIWAKENITLPGKTVYVGDVATTFDFEDLQLLARCRHSITGNSTFSWWGAWLGRNSDRVVIAPRKYLLHDPRPLIDFYPENWTLI